MTSGNWKVEVYKKNGSEDTLCETLVRQIAGETARLDVGDVLRTYGNGDYRFAVSGQIRNVAAAYGLSSACDKTGYTVPDDGTGDLLVSGGVLGVDYTYVGRTLRVLTDTSLTVSGKTTKDSIMIPDGITANITIKDLQIVLEEDTFEPPINQENSSEEKKSTLNLTLEGRNTVKAAVLKNTFWESNYTDKADGVNVRDNKLIIQGDGFLHAEGGKCYDAWLGRWINGGSGIHVKIGGQLTIKSGTVEAVASCVDLEEGNLSGAAGIGGCPGSAEAGKVIIAGGVVTAIATPDSGAAGIGGGTSAMNGMWGYEIYGGPMDGFQATGGWIIAEGAPATGKSDCVSIGTAQGSGNYQQPADLSGSQDCVIIDRYHKTATVYGNPSVSGQAELPKDFKMSINVGQKVTVEDGAVLVNNGEITLNGTLQIKEGGQLINNGYINFGLAGQLIIEPDKTYTAFNSNDEFLDKGSGTSYPQRIDTETSLAVQTKEGEEWKDISFSDPVQYGDTVRLQAQVHKLDASGSPGETMQKGTIDFAIRSGEEEGLSYDKSVAVDKDGMASVEMTWFGEKYAPGAYTVTATYQPAEASTENTDEEEKVVIQGSENQISFTVEKATLKLADAEKVPQITGMYGQSLTEMNFVTEKAKVVLANNDTIEVAGSWEILPDYGGTASSKVYPEPDGDTAYEVVFVPADNRQWLMDALGGELTASVVPQVTWKELQKDDYTILADYTDDSGRAWVRSADSEIQIIPAAGGKISSDDSSYGYVITTSYEALQKEDLTVYIEDSAGQKGRIVLRDIVSLDEEAPDGTLTLTWKGQQYTYDASVAAAEAELFLQKGEGADGQNLFTISGSDIGTQMDGSGGDASDDGTETGKLAGSKSAGGNGAAGSGVVSIRYSILSEPPSGITKDSTAEEVEEAVTEAGGQWQEYTLSGSAADGAGVTGEPVSLTQNGSYIIYVLVEDALGNQSYLNTERFVLYEPSELEQEEISYYLDTDDVPEIRFSDNGNIIAAVSLKGDNTEATTPPGDGTEETVLTSEQYSVTADVDVPGFSVLTLNADVLNALAEGTYTLTVTYDPQGQAYGEGSRGDAPETLTMFLHIEEKPEEPEPEEPEEPGEPEPETPEEPTTQNPETPSTGSSHTGNNQAASRPANAEAGQPSAEEIRLNTIALHKKLRLSWKKNRMLIRWSKVKNVDGYDIFAAECKKEFTPGTLVQTVNAGKKKATIKKVGGKKLKAKKNYKVQIRAFRMINGRKVYVTESMAFHLAGPENRRLTNAKKIQLSGRKLKLRAGKKKKLKASVVRADRRKRLFVDAHALALRYRSSNPAIAAVNNKGKVTARKKGNCFIYLYAPNGISQKVKVTVR